jgi:hypothetical protein
MFLEDKIIQKLKEYPAQLSLSSDRQRIEREDEEDYEQSSPRLKEMMNPSSLLSAMWFQLYLAFKGKIKLRRCKG